MTSSSSLSMTTENFFADLTWRGLVHQTTDQEGMLSEMAKGPVTLYAGFDPTAESLHVGNLVPLITLARFQKAGHRVLALVGGSTGQIGDPSGKSAERDFQDSTVIAKRTELIAAQLGHFIDFADPAKGKCVNNLNWTQGVGVLEFLREIGKHFSVNAMMHRDSVKSRLDREGAGISFTEFSYMLLQAFDFYKLAQNENCTLQIGGSDQFGNMCSGIDLCQRKLGKQAFAMTLPLLTTHDGKKFGKSEKGAIWIDPTLTSPWEFIQFWLNTADADVIRFLKMFTFVDKESIELLARSTAEVPHLRLAQKRLAQEMTDMVHGQGVRQELELAIEALFGKGDIKQLKESTFESVAKSLPHVFIAKGEAEQPIIKLLVAGGLESSNTRAVKVVDQGGVAVNQVKVTSSAFVIAGQDRLHGRFAVIKKGKRELMVVEFEQ